MKGFPGFAAQLVPGLLLIGLVSLGRPCVAQEVDAPGASTGSGSVFAPSGYLELIAPVHERIALRAYGFYIGDLKTPVAQFEVPIRATKFLTITPSYMYYSVPASGLNELAPEPAGFTDSYGEHQVRIDGTVGFSLRKFQIYVRNMYVRRFRPNQAGDINRYRGRLMIAHPLAVQRHIWQPFAAYEATYDGGGAGWSKDRVWAGVTLPLTKQVSFQPSYLWEKSDGLKDVDYLMFGLIVNTK
ncbi:MAG TPA: DUF2490 domain-containing protein [Gemmatimonadales bacterium]|jgi:hypothetical protein